jgi:hypothetical protein
MTAISELRNLKSLRDDCPWRVVSIPRRNPSESFRHFSPLSHHAHDTILRGVSRSAGRWDFKCRFWVVEEQRNIDSLPFKSWKFRLFMAKAMPETVENWLIPLLKDAKKGDLIVNTNIINTLYFLCQNLG